MCTLLDVIHLVFAFEQTKGDLMCQGMELGSVHAKLLANGSKT